MINFEEVLEDDDIDSTGRPKLSFIGRRSNLDHEECMDNSPKNILQHSLDRVEYLIGLTLSQLDTLRQETLLREGDMKTLGEQKDHYTDAIKKLEA